METKQKSFLIHTLYENIPVDMFYLLIPNGEWDLLESTTNSLVKPTKHPIKKHLDFYIVLN